MRKIFDLKCDCEMCLRFCEPPDEAKVQITGKPEDRVDLDDPWMMHMGCNVSKFLY